MLHVRDLGIQPYITTWEAMKAFTSARQKDTPDELWLLEHPSVYTQGQAGKAEHILQHNHIPIVKSDRGGQVTYHGPGQLVAYILMDIARNRIGVRTLVCQLEQILLQVLQTIGITAETHCGAPGVYVGADKIASVGLRVRNGCTYHGIALNVAMDLTPFTAINPCGFNQLKMTQIKEFVPEIDLSAVKKIFTAQCLANWR